jgi:hypothetical protein
VDAIQRVRLPWPQGTSEQPWHRDGGDQEAGRAAAAIAGTSMTGSCSTQCGWESSVTLVTASSGPTIASSRAAPYLIRRSDEAATGASGR